MKLGLPHFATCDRCPYVPSVPDAFPWAIDLIDVNERRMWDQSNQSNQSPNFANRMIMFIAMRIIDDRSRLLLCRLHFFWDLSHLFVYGYTRSGWNIPG